MNESHHSHAQLPFMWKEAFFDQTASHVIGGSEVP